MHKRTEQQRFPLVVKLDTDERAALDRLSKDERLPMATVVRRLIWKAAEAQEKVNRDAQPA